MLYKQIEVHKPRKPLYLMVEASSEDMISELSTQIFETEHEKKAHNQIDTFIQKNSFLEGEILGREYSIDQRYWYGQKIVASFVGRRTINLIQ